MLWIILTIASLVFYALSNIFDSYLTNRVTAKIPTALFYISIFNIIFLPILFFVIHPGLPPADMIIPILLVGITDVVYLFPYYKALKTEDTSVVASLFAIGKIFIPILAFFFLGETLKFAQYAGFFIIIISSALLTFDRTKFKFRKSLWLMIFASLLISAESVLYKHIFNSVGWSTGFFWAAFTSFIIILGFFIVPKIRKDIVGQFSVFKANMRFFFAEEFFTFGGFVLGTYALSLVPVVLEKSLTSFQPFVVLFCAVIFKKFFPKIFKESIIAGDVVRKTLLFCLMVLGIFLVVR